MSSVAPPNRLFGVPVSCVPSRPALRDCGFLVRGMKLLRGVKGAILVMNIAVIMDAIVYTVTTCKFSEFEAGKVDVTFTFVVTAVLVPRIMATEPLCSFVETMKLCSACPNLVVLCVDTIVPFAMLVLGGFTSRVPVSLRRTTAVSKTGFIRELFGIILPLVGPTVTAIYVVGFVAYLGGFFAPLCCSGGVRILSITVMRLPLESGVCNIP